MKPSSTRCSSTPSRAQAFSSAASFAPPATCTQTRAGSPLVAASALAPLASTASHLADALPFAIVLPRVVATGSGLPRVPVLPLAAGNGQPFLSSATVSSFASRALFASAVSHLVADFPRVVALPRVPALPLADGGHPLSSSAAPSCFASRASFASTDVHFAGDFAFESGTYNRSLRYQ